MFHLQRAILPLLAQMGLAAEIDMIRPGYVPAGKGILRLAVPPARGPLRPLAPRRGDAPALIWGISRATHLDDRDVAARMATGARTVLAGAAASTSGEQFAEISQCTDRSAAQPGAAFALFADFTDGARLGAVSGKGVPHLVTSPGREHGRRAS